DDLESALSSGAPRFGRCRCRLQPDGLRSQRQNMLHDNFRQLRLGAINADEIDALGGTGKFPEDKEARLPILFRWKNVRRFVGSGGFRNDLSRGKTAGGVTEDSETRFQKRARHTRVGPVDKQNPLSRCEYLSWLRHVNSRGRMFHAP